MCFVAHGMEMTSATSPRSSVIGVIGTVKLFFLTADFHHLDIAASPCYIKHNKLLSSSRLT